MRLTKIEQVEDFINIVKICKGDVTLTSQYGDIYNLKSNFSRYIAIGALLADKGDELELWCTDKSDEAKFLNFFHQHPEVL